MIVMCTAVPPSNRITSVLENEVIILHPDSLIDLLKLVVT